MMSRLTETETAKTERYKRIIEKIRSLTFYNVWIRQVIRQVSTFVESEERSICLKEETTFLWNAPRIASNAAYPSFESTNYGT